MKLCTNIAKKEKGRTQKKHWQISVESNAENRRKNSNKIKINIRKKRITHVTPTLIQAVYINILLDHGQVTPLNVFANSDKGKPKYNNVKVIYIKVLI